MPRVAKMCGENSQQFPFSVYQRRRLYGAVSRCRGNIRIGGRIIFYILYDDSPARISSLAARYRILPKFEGFKMLKETLIESIRSHDFKGFIIKVCDLDVAEISLHDSDSGT